MVTERKRFVRPVNDLVLIRVDKATGRTKGGIELPDTAKEKQTYGEILAVGPGHHTDDGQFISTIRQDGEIVLFNKYGSTEVPEVFGEDLVLVREGSVLAVIE